MVYPFYVEVNSSTRDKLVGVGTRAKDGTLVTTVCQRDTGCVTKPIEIRQYTYVNLNDGKRMCVTQIFFKGECIKQHETPY